MFDGEVPRGTSSNPSAISVEGNNKLCGGFLQLRLSPCHNPKNQQRSPSLKTILTISILLLALAFASVTVVLLWVRKSREKKGPSSILEHQHLKLSYHELHKATNGFSSANLIGEGSFGVVFKGMLSSNNKFVAIKVVKLDEHGARKSLIAECEALRNIRHRNLVKIITSCSSIDFRGNDFGALVFEFMPNGSLDKWLHPTGQCPKLNIFQRLNIAIDVAVALDYLHHQCHAQIVHCDLKPSNVLLDDDLHAVVSDFGLAKFLMARTSQAESSSIGLRGTIGYVAPEHGLSGEVSTQGDVYSYGILLLELFTGKRPTESMFASNFKLRDFVEMALPERLPEVIDPSLGLERESNSDNNGLHADTGNISICLEMILQVGVVCSAASPRERMDIGDVVAKLCKAKSILSGSRLSQ